MTLNDNSMINKVLFSNYKAFTTDEHGELNCLELRPITLLLGKNSSGKSSLIKLLEMISRSFDGERAKSIENSPALFHNKQGGTPIHLELINEVDKVNFTVEYVRTNGQTTPITIKINEIEILTKPNLEIGNPPLAQFVKQTNFSIDSFRFSMQHIGPWRKGLVSSIFDPKKCDDVDPAYIALLDSYKQNTDLYKNVQKWMGSAEMENQPIHISNVPETELYRFEINRNDVNIGIDDVGTGVSQVLPIIVQSFNPNGADVVAIEQPVLHLHPAVHAAVARRLAESAKQLNRCYVIESHSLNFLLGLRLAVASHNVNFTPNDIVIYFLDTNNNNCSQLVKITIDNNGQLSYWPYGVFGEHADLTRDLIKQSHN